jgi:hypothetical protein
MPSNDVSVYSILVGSAAANTSANGWLQTYANGVLTLGTLLSLMT